jgi:hypothetical protein
MKNNKVLLEVGEARKFNIKNERMIIQEILSNPGIEMEWKWFKGFCPHCKKRIEDVSMHKFKRVEILVAEGIEPEQATIRDTIVFGIDEEEKFMLFTLEDKRQEAFIKSEKFKHLTEV